MKNRAFESSARSLMVMLVLALGAGALAENPKHKVFSGFINAYTPQSKVTGPYEVRGPWSLRMEDHGTKADFNAELNMEFSDGWVITMNMGNFDPMARGAHTHHIVVCDGRSYTDRERIPCDRQCQVHQGWGSGSGNDRAFRGGD